MKACHAWREANAGGSAFSCFIAEEGEHGFAVVVSMQ
jgi:hypothetical protein